MFQNSLFTCFKIAVRFTGLYRTVFVFADSRRNKGFYPLYTVLYLQYMYIYILWPKTHISAKSAKQKELLEINQ